MNQDNEILVSIQCITFNHKLYLRQALDSFLAQKTTFGVEVIVHDDASTDGTTDILREYAEKYPGFIIPMYEEENQWKKTGMKPVFARMTDISHGKYIAYCEGDDFWQDPLKLQKQVDAMEKHPEASMCYTGFQTVDNNGVPYSMSQYELWNKEGHSGELFFDLLDHNIILTPTTLYRREVFSTDIYLKTSLRLDYFAFLSAAAIGKLIYLPERTACYRQTPTGAMATKLPWVQEKYNKIKEYFLYEYAIGNIPKPFSCAGFFAKVEMVNIALRRKMSGVDKDLLSRLYTENSRLRIYAVFAWIQIKYQNWRYTHN